MAEQRTGSVAAFLALRDRLWGWIPRPVRTRVPRTAVGFALLNLCTFALDLLLLWFLHAVLHVAYPVATTLAYLAALAAAFVVNRHFNFESHDDPAQQSALYLVVVAVNYLAFILGVNTGLKEAGAPLPVARMAAGLCEAVWMYCAMRWIVFRRSAQVSAEQSTELR